MTEEKKEEHKGEHKNKKFKLNVPWTVTGIIVIILIASIITGGFGSITGMCIADNSGVAGQKAISYLNSNIKSGTVNLVDVESSYFMTFEYSGTKYGTFISPAGEIRTPPFEVSGSEAPATTFDAPNADKPVVDLYVMSFCPYGVQAEDVMIDVVKLFGDKVVIRPRFIVKVADSKVQSLHGEYEANEDIRQACIWKNYGQTKLWNYLDNFNGNCTKTSIDTCWKDVAKTVGIDTAKIETCFASEGVSLVEADGNLADQLGVTGSPTLMINGQTYSGARTADAFKSGICTGFTTEPAECSQTLGNSTTTASGNC